LPGQWAGLSIVAGQQFEIEDVDDPIPIQICRGWNGQVVIHANGQRVELVDNVIAIDITRQQTDFWHVGGPCGGDSHRALAAEETTGGCYQRI